MYILLFNYFIIHALCVLCVTFFLVIFCCCQNWKFLHCGINLILSYLILSYLILSSLISFFFSVVLLQLQPPTEYLIVTKCCLAYFSMYISKVRTYQEITELYSINRLSNCLNLQRCIFFFLS